jgi:hypothetical protein
MIRENPVIRVANGLKSKNLLHLILFSPSRLQN